MPPQSCQKGVVLTASRTAVRSALAAPADAVSAERPSGASPIDSGLSRTTHRARGRRITAAPSPMMA